MGLDTIPPSTPTWSPDSSPVTIATHSTPAPVPAESKAVTIQSATQISLDRRDHERDRLVRKCAGRQVQVVNLMSLMPAWPKDIHCQEILDEVNSEIDEWLKT